MKIGGGFISAFVVLMLLLSPPGVAAENKGLFDSKQFTKQVMLDIRIAQVTNNPLLSRGALDYLKEGDREIPKNNDEENNYLCEDKPSLTDEDTLANMAKEVAVAPNDKIKELSSKYYCYRFDILSYFIDKHQNDILKRALDGGFDTYYVSLKNPNPYNKLYLLDQAVFAENKMAVELIGSKSSTKDLHRSLLNLITKQDIDKKTIKRREKRFRRLKLNYNDFVTAILIDDPYNFTAVNNIIKGQKLKEDNLRRIYLNALKTLIDIRQMR